MKSVGIILAGGNNERLGELTSNRATSAMPVGSCYRAIDFTLSNMSNSGIGKVAVITQYNSRSLHDHLSSAKWWDLGRKQGGLFVFSPFLSSENSFWFRGTADSIYQNITFLIRSNEPYVLITSGNAIYKMDYNDLLKYHIEKDADITVVYKNLSGQDLRNYGVLELDKNKRIVEFEEKPLEPQSSCVSLGIYIMRRELLIKLLTEIAAEGRHDFVKDILIRYRKMLEIYAYPFDGYWKTLNSVKSYYDTNMDFLDKNVRDMFIKQYPYIETKAKDEPPAKINAMATVKNSLTADGSILNGTVENSVLFRKVFTGENSLIKNSIIMEGCEIGVGCHIENTIMDKGVRIAEGRQFIGTPDEPLIIKKNSV